MANKVEGFMSSQGKFFTKQAQAEYSEALVALQSELHRIMHDDTRVHQFVGVLVSSRDLIRDWSKALDALDQEDLAKAVLPYNSFPIAPGRDRAGASASPSAPLVRRTTDPERLRPSRIVEAPLTDPATVEEALAELGEFITNSGEDPADRAAF